MSINQRKYIRFSLDIPATIQLRFGEQLETRLQQISIGGCFTDWEESIYVGDEFRMEIELPNKNFIPLACRAIYRFEHTGIGVKFIDITQFEQQLIASIIKHKLENEGVPLQVDPFALPPTFIDYDPSPRITRDRDKINTMLQQIASSDDDV